MGSNLLSWGELKTRMRGVLWPFPGEPKNLRTPHDTYFTDAANDLQKWVKCLQANNVTVQPHCATYFDCGKTLVKAPVGFVKFVYTIANGEWCDRVFYNSSSYQDVLVWARNRLTYLIPTNSGLTAPFPGVKFAEASTDSRCGRARSGIYSIHNNRMYVTPWLQSNESLVVEWDGIKKVWDDSDVLDLDLWDADVEKAIRVYVKWQDAVNHGCPTPQETVQLERAYMDARADLIWECNERTKEIEGVFQNEAMRGPIQTEVDDDVVPDVVEEEALVFAVIGDFGDSTNAAVVAAVAAMVDSWNPEFVVSVGDSSYTGSTTLAAYDADIGPSYHQYLFPYVGEYGEVAQTQKFYSAIGNHDRDPNGKAQNYAAYFNVVGKPYFNVLKRMCNLLFLDTGYNSSGVNENADGNTYDSVMGQWLQKKLAQSESPWNLVFQHHPPYSSALSGGASPPLVGDGSLSYTAMRAFPLKNWGAHLSFNGHAHLYERAEVDGFNYLTNGAGGRNALDTFVGSPADWSKKRYNADWGAQKLTVTSSKLIAEFYAKDGTLIDTLTLEK